jgi:hypothetical protein
MFKVSQDIYVNSSDSINHSKVYGTFKSVEENGNAISIRLGHTNKTFHYFKVRLRPVQ